MSKLKITIMGCGNSSGTPSIGNHWGNCDPHEPRNLRTRPSVAVQSEDTTIVIDTGTDFREQINRTDIKAVDAVLYTHSHGDHIHGIDELRVFRYRFGSYVPIYGNRVSIEELQERFSYLFVERAAIYPKVLEPHIIENKDFCHPMTVGDITCIPYEQDHGTCKSLGYRFGDTAYSTDMVDMDHASIETLKGIKCWIVDAAAYKLEKNPVHANLKKIYELNEIIEAEQVYITHLSNQMDYQTMIKELPEGYAPAYDGLELIANC